jgi:hypothetical protein
VLVLLMRGFYDLGHSDCLSGMIYIYISSFTNISTGVQAIFRFSFRNLRGCNVGITDGWFYEVCRSNVLRWYDIHAKFNDDRFMHLFNITIIIATN